MRKDCAVIHNDFLERVTAKYKIVNAKYLRISQLFLANTNKLLADCAIIPEQFVFVET